MPRAAPKRAYRIAKPIKQGFEITDPNGKGWIVGETIGQGGFGCLYSGILFFNIIVILYMILSLI